jgi:5-methylcytosine-specific restriction endonuclease McrA
LPHKQIKKMGLPPEFWVRGLFKDKHKDFQCVVCGNYGAELHHFAPQSLARNFGDNWPKWPTAYLCRPCHDLWHSTVTPHMFGVRQLQGEG